MPTVLGPADLRARILSAVAALDPRETGNRVTFRCPTCEANGRTAYAYLDNRRGRWECNRKNDCGAEGRLWEGSILGPVSRAAAPIRQPAPNQKPTDNRKFGRLVRDGRGRLSSSAGDYLLSRLPGFDSAGLEDFARDLDLYDLSPISSKDLEAAGALRLRRGGYGLVLGLRALDSGALVALQGRALGPGLPKVLSSKGGYGDAGACFGSLSDALKEADEAGCLIIVEGLVDYLTAAAAGVPAVVGVPGVGLAQKVARALVSRGWAGRLLVSLDGDNAGARGLAEIKRELERSSVELATARPDSGDLNDIWREAAGRGESGAAAVRAHFNAALDRLAFDPLRALPVEKTNRRKKARARVLYQRHRGERHSAVRSLGMTGICGALRTLLQQITGCDDLVGKHKRTMIPVCERQACPFCRGQSWKHYVSYAQEHWPAQLAIATVEVESRQAVKRIRGRLSRQLRETVEQEGSGYLTAADPANGVMVVVVTAELAGVVGEVLGCQLDSVSKNQALCSLAPCYVGAAVRASRLLGGESDLEDVESDEWVSQRSKWYSTAGNALYLPPAKAITKKVREESKVAAKEKEDTKPAPRGTADVLFHWDGDELVALTLTKLTAKARMSVLLREQISGLDPDDPGNLLDNPDIAGPVVEDWIRRVYRHHTGKELVPRGRGPDRPPRVGPGAEDARWRLRAPLEELRAVIEGG
jgi:hypothetical protein